MTARPRTAAHRVLVVILTLEFVLVAALAVLLVFELVTATPASLASAIALAVLVVLAAIWLGAIALGAARGRAWTRAAGIVWQILQAAVGIGALEGVLAQPAWGWPLIGVAVVAFLLLLSNPFGDASGGAER